MQPNQVAAKDGEEKLLAVIVGCQFILFSFENGSSKKGVAKIMKNRVSGNSFILLLFQDSLRMKLVTNQWKKFMISCQPIFLYFQDG